METRPLNRRVFVFGLPPNITSSAVQQYFSRFGPVEFVEMKRKPDSLSAYVWFEHTRDASRAHTSDHVQLGRGVHTTFDPLFVPPESRPVPRFLIGRDPARIVVVVGTPRNLSSRDVETVLDSFGFDRPPFDIMRDHIKSRVLICFASHAQAREFQSEVDDTLFCGSRNPVTAYVHSDRPYRFRDTRRDTRAASAAPGPPPKRARRGSTPRMPSPHPSPTRPPPRRKSPARPAHSRSPHPSRGGRDVSQAAAEPGFARAQASQTLRHAEGRRHLIIPHLPDKLTDADLAVALQMRLRMHGEDARVHLHKGKKLRYALASFTDPRSAEAAAKDLHNRMLDNFQIQAHLAPHLHFPPARTHHRDHPRYWRHGMASALELGNLFTDHATPTALESHLRDMKLSAKVIAANSEQRARLEFQSVWDALAAYDLLVLLHHIVWPQGGIDLQFGKPKTSKWLWVHGFKTRGVSRHAFSTWLSKQGLGQVYHIDSLIGNRGFVVEFGTHRYAEAACNKLHGMEVGEPLHTEKLLVTVVENFVPISHKGAIAAWGEKRDPEGARRPDTRAISTPPRPHTTPPGRRTPAFRNSRERGDPGEVRGFVDRRRRQTSPSTSVPPHPMTDPAASGMRHGRATPPRFNSVRPPSPSSGFQPAARLGRRADAPRTSPGRRFRHASVGPGAPPTHPWIDRRAGSQGPGPNAIARDRTPDVDRGGDGRDHGRRSSGEDAGERASRRNRHRGASGALSQSPARSTARGSRGGSSERRSDGDAAAMAAARARPQARPRTESAKDYAERQESASRHGHESPPAQSPKRGMRKRPSEAKSASPERRAAAYPRNKDMEEARPRTADDKEDQHRGKVAVKAAVLAVRAKLQSQRSKGASGANQVQSAPTAEPQSVLQVIMDADKEHQALSASEQAGIRSEKGDGITSRGGSAPESLPPPPDLPPPPLPGKPEPEREPAREPPLSQEGSSPARSRSSERRRKRRGFTRKPWDVDEGEGTARVAQSKAAACGATRTQQVKNEDRSAASTSAPASGGDASTSQQEEQTAEEAAAQARSTAIPNAQRRTSGGVTGNRAELAPKTTVAASSTTAVAGANVTAAAHSQPANTERASQQSPSGISVHDGSGRGNSSSQALRGEWTEARRQGAVRGDIEAKEKEVSPQGAPVTGTSTAANSRATSHARAPSSSATPAASASIPAISAAAMTKHSFAVGTTSLASTPQASDFWGSKQPASTPPVASQYEEGAYYYSGSYFQGQAYDQSPYAFYDMGDYAGASSNGYHQQWYSPGAVQQQQSPMSYDANWADAYYYDGGYHDQHGYYSQGYSSYAPQQQEEGEQQQQYTPYAQPYPNHSPQQQAYVHNATPDLSSSCYTSDEQQHQQQQQQQEQQVYQGAPQPSSTPREENAIGTLEASPQRDYQQQRAPPENQHGEEDASLPQAAGPQSGNKQAESLHAAADRATTTSSDAAEGAVCDAAQPGIASPNAANTVHDGSHVQRSSVAATKQVSAGAAGLSLMPLLWTGLFQLKQRRFVIELRFLVGELALATAGLLSESAVIRVTKRAPLSSATQAMLRRVVADPQQSCVCLGRAKDPMHRAAFVAFTGMYLRRKDSVGFVHSGHAQLYVLPACSFARECLQRAAPLADAGSALESDILFVMCFSQSS